MNFIKDTETRIRELSARRDELSRETGHESHPDPAETGSELGKSIPASVIVQPCVSGFEVVVSSNSSGPQALPLSRVFEALQEQGLDVISSLTTRVNERLMHTIQVEVWLQHAICQLKVNLARVLIIFNYEIQVNSFGCLDLAWLQQKLVEELILSTGY